jgi:hypothetical protein
MDKGRDMENLLMVVLAKSYKPGGRCIAGRLVEYTSDKNVTIGGWVRPVANDGTGKGALTDEMYSYEDGAEARILDIVEVPVIRSFPIDGQPENFAIDEAKKWKKIGSLSAGSIPIISEDVDSIWNDPQASSSIVTANYDQQGLVSQSLCLIKPINLLITLSNDYNEFKCAYKKKISASFDYLGVSYEDISITCPSTKWILTNQYPEEGQASKNIPLRKGDNYVLCMSLSPRFGGENHHYKLVATIFDYDGYLQREYAA